MEISITAEVIGLVEEPSPLIEVKPKKLTLMGKGHFSLLLCINLNDEIKNTLLCGLTKVVRRVLLIRIKETRMIYHFPIEVTYYP
jgi:hypothetical protein